MNTSKYGNIAYLLTSRRSHQVALGNKGARLYGTENEYDPILKLNDVVFDLD